MYRAETTSVRMLQAVAVIAGLAILLWSLGLPSIRFADAANITTVSDTLTDSDLGVVSDHTIVFTTPTGIAAGENIVITFPTGFNMGTVDFEDMDLNISGSEKTLAAAPSGATWGAVVSGQDVTFTSGTDVETAYATATIQIGDNATGGAANEQVTNHASAGSYVMDITAGDGVDSGSTHIVILDDVVVSAAVDTVFNFSVSGFPVAAGVAINGTSTTATSTATLIPFGTLAAGHVETVAQLLNVTTNASNGFVVTVQQDTNLLSSTGADIDGFIDGAYGNTPVAWVSPTPSVTDEDTWGHWGITSSDDLNASEFASNKWVAASTTARQVFENDGPADGSTANVGSTTVGFQVEISALQEAGDDYSTSLTYIATPTF